MVTCKSCGARYRRGGWVRLAPPRGTECVNSVIGSIPDDRCPLCGQQETTEAHDG